MLVLRGFHSKVTVAPRPRSFRRYEPELKLITAGYSQESHTRSSVITALIDDLAKLTTGKQNKQSFDSTRSHQEQYYAAYSCVVYPK